MNPDQASHEVGEWREVVMARDDLEGLPPVVVPEGFSIRAYEPGDEAAWLDIHRAADPFNVFTASTFREQFGDDEEELRARQKYLLGPDGAPVGTATAWRTVPSVRSFLGVGRVHWVAVRPEFQRRGGGRALACAVLYLLRDLGHRGAILSTDSRRPGAIALYESLGFREAELL